MTSFFKPKMPAAPAQVDPTKDPKAIAAAAEEAKRQRRLAAAGGRASTMYTGAQGDTSAANVSNNQLLGQ